MNRVIYSLCCLALLTTACGSDEDGATNKQIIITTDMGSDQSSVDMGIDTPDQGANNTNNANNGSMGPYTVTTVEADPDAQIQFIEGTSQFVTFPNAAGQVSIWDAETGESRQLQTTAPGPGLVWSDAETGEYVVAASSGNRVVLNAWGPESEEFATFAGPLATVTLPPKGGHIGYAARPDGSLAMIDFVERSALIIDSAFGEDGQILDIEEGPSGRVLYRSSLTPEEITLFTPELREKTPAPAGTFAQFVDDGKYLFVSDEMTGTRLYDPVEGALLTVAPQGSVDFEVYGRYMVVKFPERNDILYDLQEARSVLVALNIVVPPNPWSPDGRHFVFTGRGPTTVDSMTGTTRVIVSTGTIAQLEFSDDGTRMALTYSAFRPRLIVFDLENQATVFTDEVALISFDDANQPEEVSPISMDKAGRYLAYFDTATDGVAVAVYDGVDEQTWSITATGYLSPCGLDMADDGSSLIFPLLEEGGNIALGQWIPGSDTAQKLGDKIVFVEGCQSPVASPNHDKIVVVEETTNAQRVSLRQGTQLSTVADGFRITRLTVTDDFNFINLRYNTITGERPTMALARYDVAANDLKVLENTALRVQEVFENEFGMAYRYIPYTCMTDCLVGVRALLYGDDDATDLAPIAGRVRGLIGPHVLFQGGRENANGEIVTELQLARRVNP